MSKPILIATLMRPQGDTGVQTHFRAFAGYLGEVGRHCELITPYNAPLWLVYPAFGLRILVNFFNGAFGVWWYRYWHAFFLRIALNRRLKSGAACVVYAQCPLSAQAALKARVSKDQRVVMVVHFNISQADEWTGKGLIPHGGRLFRAIQAVEAEVLPRLDGLVFVSEFMRRELVARIPAISNVAAIVVPNFLPDPGMAGEDYAVSDLINIGTLEARKNQRYALEIVAGAVRLGRPLSLTIVGDGPDRTELESLVLEFGIGQHVTFAGFVSNAVGLMPRHHACLHVARMESFGIVLIEAMAHGLPVFAPAVGGIPEVFIDGREGRLIPQDDPLAAAQMIIDWLDCQPTMAMAQRAARAGFLARFEAGKVAVDLEDFLDHPDKHASRRLGRSVSA